MEDSGLVRDLQDVTQRDIWINGGYFMFKREVFDRINYGEELVYEPFQRLIQQAELICYKYSGFFGVMDTFKEKQQLDDMYARGETPWEVWQDTRRERFGGRKVELRSA
jgi:glucose-1-phosphate cytidylyltransferase